MTISFVSRTVVNRVIGALVAAASVVPALAGAQTVDLAPSSPLLATGTRAPVPYAVGEELTYKATFGGLRAGTARMKVTGIDTVRGRQAYHVVFTLDGGIPLFRVHDRYDSWIDVVTLSSLRHRQQISEGRYKRTTLYEIYPERGIYEQNDVEHPSVAHPLDDGSFIYAARSARVKVGETRRDDRYFRPDRNPVVLSGLRKEVVRVEAGDFYATVVRPTIKANGIFSENGEAQIWFTDDAHRYPVLLKSKFAKFSLTLELKQIVAGERPASPGSVADVSR
ncbi:MAG TPA: DUF3108 domain-containing protein [Gemmatimonadaceae bacterium]|jgi:hypothetical protein|nr:DUF3108 domain-containing protein [Gemmatimonadaceae bacterium]